MKKLLFAAFIIALLCLGGATASFAAETATLPQNKVQLNDIEVISEDREYPLLFYKNIVYIPMTYYDCRYMGLTTNWDNETSTLEINKENITCAYRPYTAQSKNDFYHAVTVCSFNITVNGEVIDNSKEEYPLLLYRDVTYFPLTWRFAVQSFGWQYSYSAEEGLKIESDNFRVRELVLPDIGGMLAAGTDGEYYYYTGSENKIYRALCADPSRYEAIHTMPGVPNGGIDFSYDNAAMYLSYHIGGATMGTSFRYKINKDGSVEQSDEGTHASSGVGYNKYFIDGEGVDVTCYNSGRASTSVVIYTRDGKDTELTMDGVRFGEKRIGGVAELNKPQLLGDTIYVTGYVEADTSDSRLYAVDTVTGEIRVVSESVGSFYAFSGWDTNVSAMVDMIIYDRGGKLYRNCVSGEVEIDSDALPMVTASGDYLLFVAEEDGGDVRVKAFASYGIGSISGAVVFEASEAGNPFYVEDGELYYLNYADNQVRFALFNEFPTFFKTSDFPLRTFYNNGTLIYTLWDENRIVEVDLTRQ